MTVSVVMCFHNPGKWLVEAIESVARQTMPLELILVDDGSTDESAEIAVQAAATHKWVKVLRNQEHRGIGYSKRRGCEAAAGDVIAIVDGDDRLAPNAFEKVLDAYRADVRRQFAYTTHLRGDRDLDHLKRADWVGPYPADGSMAKGTDVVSNLLTFRRSLYRLTDGYGPDQRFATDKQLVARFEELTLPHFVDDAPYLYRSWRTPEAVGTSAAYFARVREWAAEREAGVSVVIPYHNRKGNLLRALASIDRLKGSCPVEVVLACWKDCDVEAKSGVRVIFDHLSPSFNRGRLRNLGALAARYRHLFFLDADVTVDANFLAAYDRHVSYDRA